MGGNPARRLPFILWQDVWTGFVFQQFLGQQFLRTSQSSIHPMPRRRKRFFFIRVVPVEFVLVIIRQFALVGSVSPYRI
jgi:hypothetical protein